jgi:hypothetical protein
MANGERNNKHHLEPPLELLRCRAHRRLRHSAHGSGSGGGDFRPKTVRAIAARAQACEPPYDIAPQTGASPKFSTLIVPTA